MTYDDSPIREDLPEMEAPKSKTRRKKEMTALQKLGERLVGLPVSYLKKSGIPQELLEALLSMKNMRTHEARRRHMQHIGALMRSVDPEQVRRVLDHYGQPGQTCVTAPARTDLDHAAQALVSGAPEMIEDMVRQSPHADRTRLRQLVRNAKAEAGQGSTKRAFAMLKSYLAQILE